MSITRRIIASSSVSALFLALALPALAEEPTPTLVTAPVDKVFVPLGFDDNDDAEIVLQGYFPNTCYKVGPATATVDVPGKKITIEAGAWHYRGAICAAVMVPFIQPVKMGPLPVGDYEITVIGRPGAEAAPLNIVRARSRNPDDFLYAPVENVSLERDVAGRPKLVLEGNYPYTIIGCMKMVEVRTNVTPGHVLVVQPIAEMYEDDADCVDQVESKKFRVEQVVEDVNERSLYLAHVRVLAGQSVNRLFDLND